MKDKHIQILSILLIFALGLYFQYQFINEFPSHIHAWAQSDRYSIALGFVRNDLNLFAPETFLYNHNFPNDWDLASKTTITAVDFPIHDYMVAVIMKISGVTSPWIFRLYTLVYSFLGLLYLYKLAKLITKDLLKALFVVLFAATSPVFIYYQGGFLPTIPSLANAFIACFFYMKYIHNRENMCLYLSVLFLTLATLNRSTFAIPLLALFGVEFVRILRGKTTFIPKIIPVLLSISVIVFYVLFNNKLRSEHGSQFLNYLEPATSLKEFYDIIIHVKDFWLKYYFTKVHFLILILGFFSFLTILFLKRIKWKHEQITFLFFSTIILIGSCCFALVMFKKFKEHDYYFLDVFYLPLVFLLIFSLSVFPLISSKTTQVLSFLTMGLFCIYLIPKLNFYQNDRRATGPWDKTEQTIQNFQNSKEFLDSIGVPKNAKILVMDACAPNIPFILMQRKGFALMSTEIYKIENALTWNFDYLIFQNSFFMQYIYSNYPSFSDKIEIIAKNEKISVCRLKSFKTTSIRNYFELKETSIKLKEFADFETVLNSSFENKERTKSFAFSGAYSCEIRPTMPYGLTYKTKKVNSLEQNSTVLLVETDIFSKKDVDAEIIVSIASKDKSIYYNTVNIKNLVKVKNQWNKLELVYHLPKILENNVEFSLFINNPNKQDFVIDNFGFTFY